MGKVSNFAGGLGSIFMGPDVPDMPDPPPEPEPPAPLVDPEDEVLKQKKRRAAAQRYRSGVASTVLSDSAKETLG